MTTPARQWVAAHAEQPPAALRGRLDALLTTQPAVGDATVSAALFTAGEALLAEILSSGSTQRDAALDLLTADALVTYAFEAAAADPATLDARAALAMRTISALVDVRTS
jgi:membrane protein required for beta-lactamase induction